MVRKNGDEEAAEEAEYDAIILSKQAVVPEKTGMIQTGGNPPEELELLLISFTIEEGDHDMDVDMGVRVSYSGWWKNAPQPQGHG